MALSLVQRQKTLFKRRKLRFVWLMLAFPLIQFAIFFVFVNINSIIMSFQYFNNNGQMVFSFNNYTKFFSDLFVNGTEELRNAIGFSFIIGINDFILVMISTLLAFFLYKKMPLEKMFRVIFFLPSIISIVVYVTAYRTFFQDGIGVIPNICAWLGIQCPMWFADEFFSKLLILLYCLWVGTGYNILVIGGAMANINKETIECAKLEGVGYFREFFQIIIPMIWPTLVVAFLGSTTVVFTFFMQVQLILGDTIASTTNSKTIAYIINMYASTNANWAATIGVIFSIVATPIILGIKKGLDRIGRHWGYR